MEDNRNNIDNEKQIEDENEVEEEEEETLKKRICSHPLYGLLVQAHIDCLKVSGISDEGQSHSLKQKKLISDKSSTSSSPMKQPELDHFMEAYCLALRKLKEAMEEPQHQTVSFINTMHLQLRDLISPPSSGGDDDQNNQIAEFSF